MDLLEIGKIVRIHGIKGAVKVISYLDDFDFSSLKNVLIDNQPAVVEKVLPLNGAYSIKFDVSKDADRAEDLKNKTLYIDRTLYQELEGKVYLSDLIGCNVLDENGTKLGELVDFEDYGATVVLDIKSGAVTYSLPYVADIIEYDNSKQAFITTKQKFEDLRV